MLTEGQYNIIFKDLKIITCNLITNILNTAWNETKGKYWRRICYHILLLNNKL